MSMTEDTRDADRVAFIEGLRDAATFLEQNPAAHTGHGGECVLYHYVTAGDGLLKIAELIGGPFEQEIDGNYFMLRRRFGPVTYQLYTAISEVASSVPAPVVQDTWRLDAEVRDRLEWISVTA